jgi:MFS family permease
MTDLMQPDAVRDQGEVVMRRPAKRHGQRRAAMIVASSLLAGLVAAIALVAGPFADGREPAITGALLLGFALGWALLAVLSVRFTDRPQRWATVPAAAMAVVGAGLIVLAPGATALTALGWCSCLNAAARPSCSRPAAQVVSR